jgi:hypothetical protein
MKGLQLFCFTSLVGSVLAVPKTSCARVKSRASATATSSSTTATSTSSSVVTAPTVDLEYEIHQATLNVRNLQVIFLNGQS